MKHVVLFFCIVSALMCSANDKKELVHRFADVTSSTSRAGAFLLSYGCKHHPKMSIYIKNVGLSGFALGGATLVSYHYLDIAKELHDAKKFKRRPN